MAYFSYNKLWESEFDNIVFKKDKVQHLNINRLKLEVHDTYEKDEKITTNFEPVNDEIVVNKAYLNEKLSKIQGQMFHIEKDYNEFKSNSNKQSIEELLIQTAVQTTFQIMNDNGLFDKYNNADEVFKGFFVHNAKI